MLDRPVGLGVGVAVGVAVSAGVLVGDGVGVAGGRVAVGGAVVGDGNGLVGAVATDVCVDSTREIASGVKKFRASNSSMTSCTIIMIASRTVLSLERDR